MAAPTIRAVGAVATSTTTPVTATLPTHATGDLLILFVGVSANGSVTPSITTPTNWTEVGKISVTSGTLRAGMAVYAKKAASGSETNPATTCSPSGSTAAHLAAAAISITTGTWKDTGTLTDAWEDVTTNTGTDSVVGLTGLATAGDDRLCLAGIHAADNRPTGMTNDGGWSTVGTDSDSATGIDGYFARRSLEPASGGGSASFTATSGGTIGIAGVSFGLKPSVMALAGAFSGTATPAGELWFATTTTPTLSSVTPNPVEIPADLTVAGSVGGMSQALAGTPVGASTVTGEVTHGVPMAGALAGTSTVTGLIGSSLVGSVTGAATPTANLTNTKVMAGSLAGAGALTGDATNTKVMAGTLAGTAANTPTCDLTATSGTTTTTPYLSTVTPNPVEIGTNLTVAGSVGGMPQALAGALAGVGTLAGAVTHAVPLAGTLAGTSALTGETAGSAALAGILVGTSTATAGASHGVPLAGALGGTASASLTPRAPTPSFTSITPSPATVGQTLTLEGAVGATSQALAGTPAGTATPTAAMTLTRQLAGTPVGTATPTAAMTLTRQLAGAPAGASIITGFLKKPITLPHTFVVGDAERTTGVADNDSVVMDVGEWIEYRVVVGADGSFRFASTITPDSASVVELLVDDVVKATWSVP